MEESRTEKWKLNPDRWNRRPKSEAEGIVKYVAPSGEKVLSSFAKMGEAFAEGSAREKEAQSKLDQVKVREDGRKHESDNDKEVALAGIKLKGEQADKDRVSEDTKNTMKYGNQRYEIERKWNAADRFLDHLERQDELALMGLEKGLLYGNVSQGNSDAIAMSVIGLLPAPQAHRQLSGAQAPVIQLPQASSAESSNLALVPHK